MITDREIRIGPNLLFEVSSAGDPGAPLVLLLHGFAVSRYLYDEQLPALAEAGFYAAAPNQRGYSPAARPNPSDVAQYDIDLLIADALDLVGAMGYGDRRFHLVGHDWGGSLRRSPGLANHAVAAASRSLRARSPRRPGTAAPLAASQGLP